MTSDEEASRVRLEAAILGAEPDLTSEEVSRASEFSLEQTERLWRALGFPNVGTEAAFTSADVGALSLISATMESGALDEETVLRMTRAVGQTMARLADWQVATLVRRVEDLESGEESTGSRMGSALRLAELVGPHFEQLLIYAWRRHLAASAARIEALGANDENLHVVELTVGFADLVGFSEFTNELGDDEIGEVVEEFETRCLDAVAHRHGRVIKTQGDSVLFVADTPERAYAAAEDIVHAIADEKRLPDVRIGLASGPVVLRLGDVFGPPVNLAARMMSVARRNRIIVDRATAEGLPEERFETKDLPVRPLRGFGDVSPIAVRRRPGG